MKYLYCVALTQTEAVWPEWESSLRSAWRVVCREGNSPAGGGWEAAAGERESPTVRGAGQGEKKSTHLMFYFSVLCVLLLVCVVLWPRVSLQAEGSNAELSLLLNKLQSEAAALTDSLAKMGSMNEGLAQDKSDLNTYILQVRGFPECDLLLGSDGLKWIWLWDFFLPQLKVKQKLAITHLAAPDHYLGILYLLHVWMPWIV